LGKGLVVTISGPPGSGKSTLAKLLSKRDCFKLISIGEIFREMARERGMSLEEFSERALRDLRIDEELDRKQKEIVESLRDKEENLVVDSRLGGWILEDADLKVYLHAPLEVRGRRVSERDGIPLEEAIERIRKRECMERERYMRAYGIDLEDIAPYDLIINSEKWEPEGLLKIIECALKFLKGVDLHVRDR